MTNLNPSLLERGWGCGQTHSSNKYKLTELQAIKLEFAKLNITKKCFSETAKLNLKE